jgi:hypothetical protein
MSMAANDKSNMIIIFDPLETGIAGATIEGMDVSVMVTVGDQPKKKIGGELQLQSGPQPQVGNFLRSSFHRTWSNVLFKREVN